MTENISQLEAKLERNYHLLASSKHKSHGEQIAIMQNILSAREKYKELTGKDYEHGFSYRTEALHEAR